MATLRILNARGDTAVMWKPADLKAGDREAKAAVKEAERIFRKERARGATAFKLVPGQPAERIDTFDPGVDADTVLVPQIAGG